jgi:hypothetical protein
MRADVIVERPRETRVYRAARKPMPLLTRFGSKLVLDILPAALASVIGGILFTHFQFGRVTPTPVQQVSPASAEVLALVRDEHDAIIGYLRSQMAAEKNRLAAQDAETARAVADAKAELDARDKAGADLAAAEIKLASAASVRAGGAPAPQMKVALPRAKPANPAVRAPLVIAQAGQQAGQPAGQNVPQNEASAASDRLARDPDSLLAKTLDLKDQVVAATRHAVAAIGDVFASVGERFGGPAPTTRQFSSDS